MSGSKTYMEVPRLADDFGCASSERTVDIDQPLDLSVKANEPVPVVTYIDNVPHVSLVNLSDAGLHSARYLSDQFPVGRYQQNGVSSGQMQIQFAQVQPQHAPFVHDGALTKEQRPQMLQKAQPSNVDLSLEKRNSQSHVETSGNNQEEANNLSFQEQVTQAAQAAVRKAIERQALAKQVAANETKGSQRTNVPMGGSHKPDTFPHNDAPQKRFRRRRTASVNPIQRQIPSNDIGMILRQRELAELAAKPNGVYERARSEVLHPSNEPSQGFPRPSGTLSMNRQNMRKTAYDFSPAAARERLPRGPVQYEDPLQASAFSFEANLKLREQEILKQQRELLLLRHQKLVEDMKYNRKLLSERERQRKALLEEMRKRRNAHRMVPRKGDYLKAMASYRASRGYQVPRNHRVNSSPPMPGQPPQGSYLQEYPQSAPPTNGFMGSARTDNNLPRSDQSSLSVTLGRKRPSPLYQSNVLPSTQQSNEEIWPNSNATEPVETASRFRQQMFQRQLETTWRSSLLGASEGKQVMGQMTRERPNRSQSWDSGVRNFNLSPDRTAINPPERMPARVGDSVGETIFETTSNSCHGATANQLLNEKRQFQDMNTMETTQQIEPVDVFRDKSHMLDQPHATNSFRLHLTSQFPGCESSKSPWTHQSEQTGHCEEKLPSYEDTLVAQRELRESRTQEEKLTSGDISTVAKRLVSSSQEWLKQYFNQEGTRQSEQSAVLQSHDSNRLQCPLSSPSPQATPISLSTNMHSNEFTATTPDLFTYQPTLPMDGSTVGHFPDVCDSGPSSLYLGDPETSNCPSIVKSEDAEPATEIFDQQNLSPLTALRATDTKLSLYSSECSEVTSPFPATQGDAVAIEKTTSSDIDADAREIQEVKVERDQDPANEVLTSWYDEAVGKHSTLMDETTLQGGQNHIPESGEQCPGTAERIACAGGGGTVMRRKEVRKRRRRKMSKFKSRAKLQRSISAVSTIPKSGRRPGRPRRSDSAPSMLSMMTVKRQRFQDFVPTILPSRTRNAGSGHWQNYRLMYDSRNIQYELEVERQRKKIIKRGQRLRSKHTSGSLSALDTDEAEGVVPTAVKRRPRGRPPKRRKINENSCEAEDEVERESVDEPSCSYLLDDGHEVNDLYPLRVVLDENCSNHIKMKFLNVRSMHSQKVKEGEAKRHRRGRPPKSVKKRMALKQKSPTRIPSPHQPPVLEPMPSCDKENENTPGDVSQGSTSDITELKLTSSKYFETSASRPEPPLEMTKMVVNKTLGETPLHRAAILGSLEVVSYCVDYRVVDVNARDNAGYTALHESCVHGHLNVAQYLLSHGADVNASAADGTRPIHDAVDNDRVQHVRLLLSYGADPLLPTHSGRSTTQLAPHRSDAMRTLLLGYLRDVNGDRATLEYSQQRTLDYQWNFSGSCSALDASALSQADLFAEGPELEENDEKNHAMSKDGGVVVEFSEKPMLPTVNMWMDDQNRYSNWILLEHVTERLGVSRDELLASHPELRPVTLPADHFWQSVGESQVARAEFSSWNGDKTDSDPACSASTKQEVTLLVLDDTLREILGVTVEYV